MLELLRDFIVIKGRSSSLSMDSGVKVGNLGNCVG